MRTAVAVICAMLVGTMCFAGGETNPKQAELLKKLDTIIVPTLDFREANLADVVQFFKSTAKENDPDNAGVNIVLMDRENKTTITFNVEKVSLHKALKLAAEMAGLTLDIEDDVVVLRAPKEARK